MSGKQQESEILEYKESLAEKEVAGRDICAFANKNGGTLYFGIKNDGTCVGMSSISEKTVRDFSQFYHDNFEPRLYPDVIVEEIGGKEVLKVVVAKSNMPHHTFKNVPYIRVGSATNKMAQSEYQKRLIYYRNVAYDFSAEICEGLMFEDLDTNALKKLQKQWLEKRS